ncbi:TPA: IS1 family transposase [Escherichia coli]|nr:IS1 family transposase [Escherichia coli]
MASVSISCPSCSATDGVVRNGKSTAGHQRYLCSHCRKTWQLQFTYTASQPGTHQKIIDMAMNGVGCRATARIISKRYTQRIERHNLNLRQHLARLGRKSLSFSKSVELHDKVIGHYLNIKHYQ